MGWLAKLKVWIDAAKARFIQSKPLAELFKEWLLCISLLGAGAWAAYTFSITQQEKRADQQLAREEKRMELKRVEEERRQELERKERERLQELAMKEAERLKSLRPEFDARLEVQPLVKASGRYIKAIATLENKGTDGLWVDLKSYSLSLRKVTFVKGKEQSELVLQLPYESYSEANMLEFKPIRKIYLAQNSHTQLAYLAKVDNSLGDPVKVTFMASYQHEKFTEALASQHMEGMGFTVQPSEYVFFDKR